MKLFRRLLKTICLVLCIISACALTSSAQDSSERQFRILFISSYSYYNASVPEQLKGFQEGIEGIDVEITYEFMDSDQYYGAVDIQNFDKYLRYKVFSARNFDLVVVADDPALRYVTNIRSELFPNIPLVFMGVNNKTEAVTAAAMRNTTGIVESPDFEGNYALMKSLFPERKHVYVVVDSSVAGQGDYVEFMKFKENHPELWATILNTSYYTAAGLEKFLSYLGDEDVILFLDFSADGNKKSYSLQYAANFLTKNAPTVPIIRLATSNIGHGVLGGISYSYSEAGRIAGEACKDIFRGESVDDMPLMTTSITTTYFDQEAMDRFGLKYKDLPSGCVIINEHKNLARFYRENTVLSNLVIVIVFLMIAIIIILYISNIFRKKAIRTDFLTQMPNRKKIIEDINQAITFSVPYGIIMLDVDHFKSINDTYGHNVGDEIIAGVGERLKKLTNKKLKFARLGGDEFCGMFTDPSKENAKEICESIIKAVKKPFKTSKGDLKLTVSIGCAMFPMDTKDNNEVMVCADKALYITKEKGRNGYTLFSQKN